MLSSISNLKRNIYLVVSLSLEKKMDVEEYARYLVLGAYNTLIFTAFRGTYPPPVADLRIEHWGAYFFFLPSFSSSSSSFSSSFPTSWLKIVGEALGVSMSSMGVGGLEHPQHPLAPPLKLAMLLVITNE